MALLTLHSRLLHRWSSFGTEFGASWRSQDRPLAEAGPGAPHFVSGDDNYHFVAKVRTAHRTLRPRLARFLAATHGTVTPRPLTARR
jgi:hypothetical protein